MSSAAEQSGPLRILSLGAGVQSSTVYLMACVQELPRLDYAIFADTGWEPKAVYEYLDWLEEYGRDTVPIIRVSAGNIRQDSLNATVRGVKALGERSASMPFFTKQEDGSVGIIRRQCTSTYKVEPIEKAIRSLVGLKPRQPWSKAARKVELWLGISAEEMRRVRVPDAAWKTHRYPLIYDLHKPFRRHDCLHWLKELDFPLPDRSACIGCPFHSDAEWRSLKEDPEAWADVTAFDERIRKRGGMRGDLFLHKSGLPLGQIDFSTAEERGQTALSFRDECTGYCGT